jgi:leucine dehydrogenase
MIDLFREQDHIRDLPEFDKHSLVTFLHDHKTGMEGFIVIHRKNKDMPSFGATRMWNYVSDLEALKDALRLSKLMSYKAALAGLKCGGAKGVIIQSPNVKNKKEILRAYAEKLTFYKDHFITGTDVGLFQEDLKVMKEKTPNIVGFNDNSTEFTALGLYYSLQCCLEHIYDNSEIAGRTFAIQGVGKVGTELIKLIYNEAGKIYVTDINPDQIAEVVKQFPNVTPVEPADIHKLQVDVFSPCALSHSLNSKSITELKCRIVVGSANNQLENESIGELLHKLGILYAPDYVVNAGGLIAVYDESEHSSYDHKRVLKRVEGIKTTLSSVLTKSYKQRKATNIVANEMAEKIFNKYS